MEKQRFTKTPIKCRKNTKQDQTTVILLKSKEKSPDSGVKEKKETNEGLKNIFFLGIHLFL
jgi:hypothetical protein